MSPSLACQDLLLLLVLLLVQLRWRSHAARSRLPACLLGHFLRPPSCRLRVLDLGSGSGRDCYVCSALVGEKGSVTGLDMTEEQLEVCASLHLHSCSCHACAQVTQGARCMVPAALAGSCALTPCHSGFLWLGAQVARAHVESYTRSLGYAQPNMRFVKGLIEYLDEAGLSDSSADLVVSNCVVNLSPDKARVLREVYCVLSTGGEFHFSDVYCDRRLPETVRKHEVST